MSRILLLATFVLLELQLLPDAFAGESSPMPQWDGKEAIADYAKRVNLPLTKTLDLGGGVKLEMLLIPAGKFIMGTSEPEPIDEDRFHSKQELEKAKAEYMAAMTLYKNFAQNEKPAHKVAITKPFYLGKYTVTQEQYQQVIRLNINHFKGKDNPVDMVSWDNAQEFCKKLGQATNQTLRLPTEAEWEYACRAGTSSKYYSGDNDEDLKRVSWYSANSNGSTHPVGQKEPNKFGLYDMHGNVWQLCQDWYDNYKADAVADPQGSEHGQFHVLRGGAWLEGTWLCRSASRPGFDLDDRHGCFGFRVVVPVVLASPPTSSPPSSHSSPPNSPQPPSQSP